MRVSIIIAAKNAAQFITETLDAALGQTFKAHDIIVVDDGSIDTTEAVVRQYVQKNPQIKLHVNPGRGIADARNYAIDKCEGELLAIMDADDISYADRLALQVAEFVKDPHLAALGGAMRVVDREHNFVRVVKPSLRAISNFTKLPIRSPHIPNPTAMIRKSVFFKVGKYRPVFEVAEDMDLLFRLEEVGALRNLQQEICAYRLHDMNTSKRAGLKLSQSAVLAMASAYCRHKYKKDPLSQKSLCIEQWGLSDQEVQFFKAQEIISRLSNKNSQCIVWSEVDEIDFLAISSILQKSAPDWYSKLKEMRVRHQ